MATAWALAELGRTDTVLIERERTCGAHSSGRNAGMIRTAVEDPAIAVLARESRAILEKCSTDPDFPPIPFHRHGSFLLGATDRIPAEVREAGDHRFISMADAAHRVALLDGLEEAPVLWTPGDGIVETHAYLEQLLARCRRAGVRVVSGTVAKRACVEEGRVQGVELDDGRLVCRNLVVAAGGWCAEWGARSGLPIRLEPRRRHIVCTEDLPGLCSDGWPWVWDLDSGFYFRPESCGLLWSPCDERPDHPGLPVRDPDCAEWLAEKIADVVPRAGRLRVVRTWAGHRTFAPDSRFVLGADPRAEGWFWAAGLGGHGVTVAPAVGRRVAGDIVNAASPEPEFAFRAGLIPEDRGDHRSEVTPERSTTRRTG
ncbi:MAG: FAD-binding oxidoreductase [Planctomycetes bacterium]|nr:FAD-binding oxidoreductase [Planctomycetota bacterium]